MVRPHFSHSDAAPHDTARRTRVERDVCARPRRRRARDARCAVDSCRRGRRPGAAVRVVETPRDGFCSRRTAMSRRIGCRFLTSAPTVPLTRASRGRHDPRIRSGPAALHDAVPCPARGRNGPAQGSRAGEGRSRGRRPDPVSLRKSSSARMRRAPASESTQRSACAPRAASFSSTAGALASRGPHSENGKRRQSKPALGSVARTSMARTPIQSRSPRGESAGDAKLDDVRAPALPSGSAGCRRRSRWRPAPPARARSCRRAGA